MRNLQGSFHFLLFSVLTLLMSGCDEANFDRIAGQLNRSTQGELLLNSGDKVIFPDGIRIESLNASQFDGALINAGATKDLFGFVFRQQYATSMTAKQLLDEFISGLLIHSAIVNMRSISVNENEGETNSTVLASYTINTYEEMTAADLTPILIEGFGLTTEQNRVVVLSDTAAMASVQFRADISNEVNHEGNNISILTVTPSELFTDYEATVKSTVDTNNVIAANETLVEMSDQFVATKNILADLLLVIDNSGSMSEEQTALFNNATRLFSKLQSAGMDFQIGVITTGSSELRGGSFTNVEETYQANVVAGTSGSSRESGIYFAEQSLLPGGSVVEAGFPRAGATLSVVMVSDERDQYAGYASSDFDFENNVFTENGYTVHAIVSDPDYGCSGDGGSASGSEDYKLLAANTGGTFGNICQADYGATLDQIVQQAGGATYVLSNPPVPSSIKVMANGLSVLSDGENGYLYIESTNSIVFFGTAIPEENAAISVSYESVQPM